MIKLIYFNDVKQINSGLENNLDSDRFKRPMKLRDIKGEIMTQSQKVDY